jgi:hypothetical protein
MHPSLTVTGSVGNATIPFYALMYQAKHNIPIVVCAPPPPPRLPNRSPLGGSKQALCVPHFSIHKNRNGLSQTNPHAHMWRYVHHSARTQFIHPSICLQQHNGRNMQMDAHIISHSLAPSFWRPLLSVVDSENEFLLFEHYYEG